MVKFSTAVLIIFAACLFIGSAKPAHSQECVACDRATASCVTNSYGGCGCISIQNRYGGRSCAVCGFCLGFCTYPCAGGGGAATNNAVPSMSSQAWPSNAKLNERVFQQSPHMAEILDAVQTNLASKKCTSWRGRNVTASGESFGWSLLVVKNGTLLMIDNSDGTHEKLLLQNKSWVLTKDSHILAREKLF